MLCLRRTLSHWASPNPKLHTTTPKFAPILSTHKCSTRSYMSPARLVTTSPEGTKRRKLSCSSPKLSLSPPPRMAPMIQEVEDDSASPHKIELTEVESTLRELLLDVAEYIDQSPPKDGDSQVALPEKLAKEPIVLRFTGGWVRDKLLGVPSHDIDVAINKMTGFQFGLRLKEYLEIPGNPEKYGLEGVATTDKQSAKAGTTDKSKTVGGLHKIEANPEKSKHLETVTTRILGLDIDLVNLRKETYTDDSRNPQMEFGTPEEDAMRRDATVNAMFYNINTQQIEDFTGLGHKDMAKKVIRTPLEPYQTFKDDPLRVLRLIRFASRLAYTIDSQALEAMGNADIKDALRRKISRERIGVELEKALQGPDPHEAMRLILDLDLYFTIFSDPTIDESKHYSPDTEGVVAMVDELEELLAAGSDLSELLVRDKDERYSAWILASMVPYRDAPQLEAPEGRKAPPPVPTGVAREGIKATNKVSDVITAAVRHQSEIATMIDRLNEQKRRPQKQVEGDDPAARDVLGMAVRRWGPTWRSQVVYALLVNLVEQPDAVESTQRKYTTFLTQLRDLDILDACTLKPLLDGRALAKALSTPPGPWMKEALDVVMAWQLRNPDVKDPTQAIEAVKQRGDGELSSALIRHFLTLTIRPLFLKTKPDSVTAQGRAKTTPSLPAKATAEDESVTKPWKHDRESHVLDLLKWVLATLDATQTEHNWPLLIPPILTLIDDWQVHYKTLGASLLHTLLLTTPPPLLQRTNLGSVFQEALQPCLTFLPSLTPEPDSATLLATVYPTILTLIAKRFPSPSPPLPNPSLSDPAHAPRIKALDALLRKGLFYALSHTSPHHHPILTRTLLSQIPPIVNLLGIDSVKHLKYILPLLSEQLAHPVAAEMKQIELLRAANEALQSVVLNAWPRMGVWRAEVLRGVVGCWVAGGEEGLREELRETVRLLGAAVGEEVDLGSECELLVQADGRLEGLFR